MPSENYNAENLDNHGLKAWIQTLEWENQLLFDRMEASEQTYLEAKSSLTEKLTMQMEQLTRHGSKSKQVESELHQAE